MQTLINSNVNTEWIYVFFDMQLALWSSRKELNVNNTSRQTHYDFVNCTIKTETESSEHTQNNVWERAHTHTYTIERDSKWNKKKQKTKHNTGIHAQWCSTFTHTRTHMRHTHTKAEWEKKPLKTWNSHWITLTMTVEVDAPIQCYGQSAFIHFNALQRIFRCVSHVSHRMNNITGSLFICVICLRDSPSELCACEYKTCYVNDGAQNYEYWSMSSWSQGAHGI